MRFSRQARGRTSVGALLIAALLGMVLVSGCGGPAKNPSGAAGSSEASGGLFPATTPEPGSPPPPPALNDPRKAVYSYLLWISYAYRVLNSNVASRTFDPYEEVRVNSYVQYNFLQGRAIDQKILAANLKSMASKGDTATVALHEEWAYRYISTETGKYTSPVNNVAYETTYTVVRLNGDWVVHSVEATSSTLPK
jgi:hypothetical protein